MKKKKNMKKIIIIALCTLLLACGVSKGVFDLAGAQQTADADPFSIRTTRHIPADADFGKYLAGFVARINRDPQKVSEYYASALKTDPGNKQLAEDLYLNNVLLGDFSKIKPLAYQLDAAGRHGLYADYVIIADLMDQKDYSGVLKRLKSDPSSTIGSVLNPVIKAWALVGQDKKPRALALLRDLGKDKGLSALALYHEMLIEIYTGDAAAAEKMVLRLENVEPPSLSMLLSIRQFYQDKNQWNEKNPFFARYVQTARQSMGVQDVLLNPTPGARVDSPQKGVAQAFYDVAASIGSDERGRETALLLDALALHLNPDSYVSRVLMGELYENMKMYHLANAAYDQIKNPSDVVTFKKVLNMIQMDQSANAEKKLLKLTAENPGNPLLIMMLGDLYRDVRRDDLAIRYYSDAIKLFRQTVQTDTLAQVYFQRGSVYERQNKLDLAESDFLKSLALVKDNPTVLNYVGYIWLNQGKNVTEAADLIAEAHKLLPDEPHVMDSLAWVYYRQKNYQKALELAEKVADMIPSSSIVADHLGDIYMALGRKREAGYQYKKALDLSADLTPELEKSIRTKQSKLLTSN